jgi:hypothetical protein
MGHALRFKRMQDNGREEADRSIIAKVTNPVDLQSANVVG